MRAAPAINFLKERTAQLKGRRTVQPHGYDLLSNPLAERIVSRRPDAFSRESPDGIKFYYPFWVIGRVAVPKPGKVFEPEKDFIDENTGGVFQSIYIPRECCNVEFMALFFFEKIPESGKELHYVPIGPVIQVHPFIQEASGVGIIHPASGLAIAGKPDSEEKMRLQSRSLIQGVYPILRMAGPFSKVIDLTHSPNEEHWIPIVPTSFNDGLNSYAAPETGLKDTGPLKLGRDLDSNTLGEVDALMRQAGLVRSRS